MLTVGTDALEVERKLREGRLACPSCQGRLPPWSHARPRIVFGEGALRWRLTPRRARCVGCGVTHVLLSVNLLVRRRDEIGVIGAALRLADEGVSCEAIARSLGRSAGLVRGWVRRLAGRAEQVRAVFTVLQVALDPDPPPIEPASCRVADAVGREVSTTIYTASSLNSGENFLRFVATVSLSGLPNLSWAAVRKVRGTSSYGAAHELDGLGLVGVGELLAGSTHRVFLLVTAMLMRPLSTRARGV